MKIVTVLGFIFLTLIIVAAMAIPATVGIHPFIGPRKRATTDRAYERTSLRLERGQYLVDNVSGCLFCHSPHDWTKHDAPTPAGMSGAGAVFPMTGLPGAVTAPNLTPDAENGLGRW